MIAHFNLRRGLSEVIVTERGRILLSYDPACPVPAERETDWLTAGSQGERISGLSGSRAYAIADAYRALCRAQSPS